MSNLVKQYWVNPDVEKSKPHIINSNALVEAKMKSFEEERKRLMEQKEKAEEENAFKEGLILETVDGEVYQGQPSGEGADSFGEQNGDAAMDLDAVSYGVQQEAVEELLAAARAEADGILAEARAQAEQLLAKAREDAKVSFEEQKQAGYQAGEAMLQEETVRMRTQLEEEYRLQSEAMQADYDDKLARMEEAIVDAIIQVFDHVFHVQFEDTREILLYLVNNTMQNISGSKHFKIYASSENLTFLETRVEDLRNRIGNDVEIELMYDATLSAEGCRIETENGVFDCGIDTELSNIYKNIRALCGE